ncbi:hypothetical protein B0H17DRAFT_1126470 [Mycena rosella]|uniref:Uncharacterized protein n=1 Tax=Mycena rosella TaxID=1033263 RepID=A0AAD7M7M4_MYCRO|nr:hypothetical protein B0H17DRAFT_1126470 [Mycena rosella]
MPSELAIVDERDLTFTGTWTDDGSAGEFRGTTSWSAVQGSTASLTEWRPSYFTTQSEIYLGTSIGVYHMARLRRKPHRRPPCRSWSTIQSPGYSHRRASDMVTDLHNTALWTSPTLSNEAHTLVITQTPAQDSGVIFLDYVLYNTTSTTVASYFIDDSDARITYMPAWRQFTEDGDFLHTSQESTSVGDSFSFVFEDAYDFRGIRIVVN